MADGEGGSTWQNVAAIADAGGGLFTSAFNVHETRQNRRWSTEMANTAHQREVADLEAAGLNPILSVTKGGNGAPVPTAQAPQMEKPSIANSALAAQQLELLKAQTMDSTETAISKRLLTHQNQEMYTEDLIRRRAENTNVLKDGNIKDEQKKQLQKQNELIDAQITQAQNGIPESAAKANYYRGVGSYAPEASGVLHDFLQSAYGAGKLYKKVKGGDGH